MLGCLNVFRRLECVVLVAVALLAWPVYAADEVATAKNPGSAAPAAVDARVNFVVANTVFALLHEFGHAVIRDFNVLLLGLEEDSADTLAAVVLLAAEGNAKAEESHARLVSLLALAAVGNALTWKTGAERQSTEIAYWAQHSLSVRRAARIACLIYGSDTQRHAWIAERTEMPEFRRDGCADEYAMARRGAQWVREAYGARRRSPSSGAQGEIEVAYGLAPKPEQAQVRSFLQDRRILETIAEYVDAQFSFPQPLALRARVCGGPNAYWDPEAREVRLCYELLEAFWQLSADPGLGKVYAAVAAALAGQGDDGKVQSGGV